MMRSFLKLTTALAILGIGGVAYAADNLQLKAPARAPALPACTVTSCIGGFVGGSIVQAGGSLDIIGTGLTGIAQNGFAMGGQAGYEFFNGKFYFAGLIHLESDVAQNALPGTAFTDRLTYGGCARLGYSLAGVLGASATGNASASPSLPAELLSALMTPYINVCEDKRHNQPAVATGAGIEALLAADAVGRSAWTLNVDYLHYNFNQGGAAGAMGALPIAQTSDNTIKASLNYHFGSGR